MSPASFNSSDATEFIGNRILVSGGIRGAGNAIAERIQRGGATVIVNARSVPEGESADHFIRADVSKTEGTTKAISACFPTFHRIRTIRAGVQESVRKETVLP
jgi:NAD(P)-dependent dehydrogenase (short-subunit alcohol dehydrogenase family)